MLNFPKPPHGDHPVSQFAKDEFAKLDKNGNGRIDQDELPNSVFPPPADIK